MQLPKVTQLEQEPLPSDTGIRTSPGARLPWPETDPTLPPSPLRQQRGPGSRVTLGQPKSPAYPTQAQR